MALAWWNTQTNKVLGSRVLQLVRTYGLNEPSAILDIGCGEGAFLQTVREVYPHARLLGIEADEQRARTASRRPIQASVYVNHVEDLPLNDAAVDLIVCLQGVSKWDSPVKGTREVMRVLRPGGLFVLVDRQVPPLKLIAAEGFKIMHQSRHLPTMHHLLVSMVRW